MKQESGESDEYLHQAVCSLTPSGPLVRLQRRSRSNSHDVWSDESFKDEEDSALHQFTWWTAAVAVTAAKPPILFKTLKKTNCAMASCCN